MVSYYTDFRGGYAVDLPPEKMEPSMVKTAQNLFWKNGLQKRQGVSTYSTTDISSYITKGFTRQYINSTWYSFAALANASGDVSFWYGLNEVGTLTGIDAGYVWATGDVEFADDLIDGKLVAVNGVNKPAVISFSGTFSIANLESLDARTRGDDDWWAGQYDPSGDVYTDDTIDAQSTGATADFLVAPMASNAGCYVAGTYTYNKIIFNSMAAAASGTVAYEYYKGSSAWGTMDVASAPAWTSGNVALEWNFPSDWEAWDGAEDTMAGRYVARLKFSGTRATDGVSCTNLSISHTQYLTQIMADERPSRVAVHGNRLYLAAGNNVNFSPPYRLTDWNGFDTDVFEQGGNQIEAMRSMGEYLAIVKESAIHGYFGNTWDDRYIKVLTQVGTVNGRTARVVNNALFFLAKDGFRYFSGNDSRRISKHIQSDIDGYTKTNANAVNYKGEYWCCFPSNSVMLTFDPDTIRVDDMGDGRVSFFKFTGIAVNMMAWNYGGTDNGYLFGAQTIGTNLIQRIDNGNYFDGSSTDIAIVVHTKDTSENEPLRDKRYTRTKVDISKSGIFQYRIYDEYSQNYVEATMDSGTGSGHFHTYFSIPYTIDGMTFSQYLSNTSTVDVSIYGFAIEAIGRKY